ncbi:MAG: hypothetical protein KME12_24835 [Trichocoleus desertorum ATA4-8-CV12]|jgi:hydroxylaminobenzene mutase|nr:hypothetical protein [Trichocoleus desertorum ATA4-8-CV12]
MKIEPIEKNERFSWLHRSQTFLGKTQIEEYRRRYLWHGFFLFFLGCIIPCSINIYTNPRAALSAHSLGLMLGTFFISLGVAVPYIQFSRWSAKVTLWLLVVSAYIGLSIQFMAATFGLTRSFLITAKGFPGGPFWMEVSVDIAAKLISVFTLLACVIILFGLRRTNADSLSASSEN